MKTIFSSSLISLLILFLSISTVYANADQDNSLSCNKKETMRVVLEALEDGHSYDAAPCWREHEYGFGIPEDFDFNFDFELYFPEEELYDFFESLEKKMEEMEKRIEDKLKELEERIG